MPRTINSLVLQAFKRYPVPMTAWQVGRVIMRNPASVSSELVTMRRRKQVLAFLGRRKQILYAPMTLNAGVWAVYGLNGDRVEYENRPEKRVAR